jgi:hypothetical protein
MRLAQYVVCGAGGLALSSLYSDFVPWTAANFWLFIVSLFVVFFCLAYRAHSARKPGTTDTDELFKASHDASLDL